MQYRNAEHYPDPTAGAALDNIRKEEKRLNTGKRFEADWRASVPKDTWYYRLRVSRLVATADGSAHEKEGL